MLRKFINTHPCPALAGEVDLDIRPFVIITNLLAISLVSNGLLEELTFNG